MEKFLIQWGENTYSTWGNIENLGTSMDTRNNLTKVERCLAQSGEFYGEKEKNLPNQWGEIFRFQIRGEKSPQIWGEKEHCVLDGHKTI